jgi:hypothetical protein
MLTLLNKLKQRRLKMKTKIIIAAVTAALIAAFSLACYKAYKKTETLTVHAEKRAPETAKEIIRTEAKQIGTEYYILALPGEQEDTYAVPKYAPEIETEYENLIEYNDYLNDRIELALQKYQKLEQYVPEEYREFSHEKNEELVERLKNKYREAAAGSEDAYERLMQTTRNGFQKMLPKGKDKNTLFFYSALMSFESEETEDSRLRHRAYELKSFYYIEQFRKERFLELASVPAIHKQQSEIFANNTDSNFRQWKERTIIRYVKKTGT